MVAKNTTLGPLTGIEPGPAALYIFVPINKYFVLENRQHNVLKCAPLSDFSSFEMVSYPKWVVSSLIFEKHR